jgi:hypothetical protein
MGYYEEYLKSIGMNELEFAKISLAREMPRFEHRLHFAFSQLECFKKKRSEVWSWMGKHGIAVVQKDQSNPWNDIAAINQYQEVLKEHFINLNDLFTILLKMSSTHSITKDFLCLCAHYCSDFDFVLSKLFLDDYAEYAERERLLANTWRTLLVSYQVLSSLPE